MKKTLLCVLLFFAGRYGMGQDIDSLLRAAYAEDQVVRKDLIRVMSQQPLVPDSVVLVHGRVQEVDAKNQQLVFRLLDGGGWPERLSREGNKAIWMVIDHAGHDDLKRYMPFVERQAEAGVVSRSDYATMQDRMLMRDGLRQRYGTQTVVRQQVDGQTGRKTGRCYVWPVEHADGLDSLRAEVGLPPIDEYMKMVEEAYSYECVWDSSLGVDDMPVKYP